MSDYIPIDRRDAMARSLTLPEQTVGATLFADISGFTPLTEALAQSLGPRRGAEELTRQLNLVYDTLIAEVDRYGGSVIGFSGDAITCWFGEPALASQPSAPLRSVACALVMQHGMEAFAAVPLPGGATVALAMKAAVTTGKARRFLVGDPSIQTIDVLAGNTVARMATAEHLADKGDTVVDSFTAERLSDWLRVTEWREDEESGERFAVVADLNCLVMPLPWPEISLARLPDDDVRAWLPAAVFERMESGLGEFLTELRPAVALFLRFGGIEYDSDPDACGKLDAFIRWVQQIIVRYEGNLLQLTVGDKGNYLYVSFGAPIAHEDDARRAVSAALEFRLPPPEMDWLTGVQIGLSRGTMRTGSYGGSTRRTYGALGDEVNLAARLMQHAGSGDVWVSGRVYEAVSDAFRWELLPPLRVKGKKEPVKVARLIGPLATSREETGFSGAMVGRKAELAALQTAVQPVFSGKFAGMAYVYGELGMGKSRLIFELRRRLNETQAINWFTCPVEGILRQSLNPFRYFLRTYFDQSTERSADANRAVFNKRLDELIDDLRASSYGPIADELERTRSFLGAMVDLRWENSLYEQVESKLRFENMLAAFVTLIRAESVLMPTVVYIEDVMWMDEDSLSLVQVLTRSAAGYPYIVLVTSRYRDDGQRFVVPVDADVPVLAIDLNQLSTEDIAAMAAQALSADIDAQAVALLAEKTNGNPFFIEQLALDLREREALMLDDQGRYQLVRSDLAEVPANINAVLVARLDRLPVQVKAVVQTASVLGREFETRILWHMLKDDPGVEAKIKQAETAAIWSSMSEARCLFRHALLRDTAYDMQLRSRQRTLHELAGSVIETLYADELAAHAPDLAFHFGHAEELPKERRYSRLAGESALARYANTEAVTYLSRAIELTSTEDIESHYSLLLMREEVYDVQGAREAQAQDMDHLVQLAAAMADESRHAEVELRRARYGESTGDYKLAVEAATAAVEVARAANLPTLEARGYLRWGQALWRTSNYGSARERLEQALELAKRANLPRVEEDSLRNLGNVADDQGEFADAQRYFERALELARSIGDRRGEGRTLNNLGLVADNQGDRAAARDYYLQALRVCREIGERLSEGVTLNNLGLIAYAEGNYASARDYYQQALAVCREIGDRQGEGIAFNNLGLISHAHGDYVVALDEYQQALALSREVGDRQGESETLAYLGLLYHHLGDDDRAVEFCYKTLTIAAEVGIPYFEALALTFLGHALFMLELNEEAIDAYTRAVNLRRELGQMGHAMEPLAGLARVAWCKGDLAAAVGHVNTILDYLETGTLDGTTEPLLVYLTCYRILTAADDPRADQVLETANALLHTRAEHTGDASLARAFLESVVIHRELLEAWQARQQAAG